jgi:hypothetical protein
MGWTNEPILVHGIELNGLPILKNFWSTHQGDIVIVDHVKPFFQNISDAGGFEKWNASLLGGQWREVAKPALQTVYGNIRMILIGTYGLP